MDRDVAYSSVHQFRGVAVRGLRPEGTQSRQTEPKAASPAGSMKDGRKEECAATQTQFNQAGLNYGFTARADGWMSGSIVRLRRLHTAGRFELRLHRQERLWMELALRVSLRRTDDQRQAGRTQASSAGRSQEGVLRAFVTTDEGGGRRLALALRRFGVASQRHEVWIAFGREGCLAARWCVEDGRALVERLAEWGQVGTNERLVAFGRNEVCSVLM